jgi:hypothetical protein
VIEIPALIRIYFLGNLQRAIAYSLENEIKLRVLLK